MGLFAVTIDSAFVELPEAKFRQRVAGGAVVGIRSLGLDDAGLIMVVLEVRAEDEARARSAALAAVERFASGPGAGWSVRSVDQLDRW